jgi:hypothetical protein
MKGIKNKKSIIGTIKKQMPIFFAMTIIALFLVATCFVGCVYINFFIKEMVLDISFHSLFVGTMFGVYLELVLLIILMALGFIVWIFWIVLLLVIKIKTIIKSVKLPLTEEEMKIAMDNQLFHDGQSYLEYIDSCLYSKFDIVIRLEDSERYDIVKMFIKFFSDDIEKINIHTIKNKYILFLLEINEFKNKNEVIKECFLDNVTYDIYESIVYICCNKEDGYYYLTGFDLYGNAFKISYDVSESLPSYGFADEKIIQEWINYIVNGDYRNISIIGAKY